MIQLDSWIQALGYAGIAAIIFAETGLLFGLFLPGDSLLLTAGILAQRGDLALLPLWLIAITAAIVGDAVNYAVGKRAGPRLFARDDGRLFKRRHLSRAQEFYARHGGKTIVLARFMAIVRTFAPAVAGAVGMSYARFALYNVTGAIIWVVTMSTPGYTVGQAVPNLDLALMGVVIVLSLLPVGWHLLNERRRRLQGSSH